MRIAQVAHNSVHFVIVRKNVPRSRRDMHGFLEQLANGWRCIGNFEDECTQRQRIQSEE